MTTYHFNIFADYFQFFLSSDPPDENPMDWPVSARDMRLFSLPSQTGIATYRNMPVPVEITVVNTRPECAYSEWDQVNECSITTSTGVFVVFGATDYLPYCPRIEVEPGTYSAEIFYGGSNTISEDGLDGDDRYKIVLFPSSVIAPRIVFKSESA